MVAISSGNLVYLFVFYVCLCFAYRHLWCLVPKSQNRTLEPLKVELSVAVSYHVGAGTRTGVLRKSRWCSYHWAVSPAPCQGILEPGVHLVSWSSLSWRLFPMLSHAEESASEHSPGTGHQQLESIRHSHMLFQRGEAIFVKIEKSWLFKMCALIRQFFSWTDVDISLFYYNMTRHDWLWPWLTKWACFLNIYPNIRAV